MRLYRLCLCVVLPAALLFTSACFAQPCDKGQLNLGTVDDHWFYKNPDLKISFQLPEGWYMYDYPAMEKKYLRVGSDYRQMSDVLYAGGPGPVVDRAQIQQMPFEYALTLLSVAKLNDTAAAVPAPKELQQDDAISFKALYADTAGVEHLLTTIYKKLSGKTNDRPELKQGQLGELDYTYFQLAWVNKSGGKENRIFGIHHFGCIDMFIQISYVADSDFNLITDTFKDLKLAK